MGRRRDRFNKRLVRATVTRRENSLKKNKERARRDEHLCQILKNGKLPYTPGILSWLSEKLDKKASRITQDDVNTLIG
ncbi:MAG: hypothetical protein JW860_07760 [Sedimentisphaerales bacterium]|nr:hypothetical protein [Sedimentisphaerales bacterium]